MTDSKFVGAATGVVKSMAAEGRRYDPLRAFGTVVRGLTTALMIAGATPAVAAAVHTSGDVLGAGAKNQVALGANPVRNNIIHIGASAPQHTPRG